MYQTISEFVRNKALRYKNKSDQQYIINFMRYLVKKRGLSTIDIPPYNKNLYNTTDLQSIWNDIENII